MFKCGANIEQHQLKQHHQQQETSFISYAAIKWFWENFNQRKRENFLTLVFNRIELLVVVEETLLKLKLNFKSQMNLKQIVSSTCCCCLHQLIVMSCLFDRIQQLHTHFAPNHFGTTQPNRTTNRPLLVRLFVCAQLFVMPTMCDGQDHAASCLS